jgi:hypothetical protein
MAARVNFRDENTEQSIRWRSEGFRLNVAIISNITNTPCFYDFLY